VRSALLADQQGATAGYLEGVVLDPRTGQITHGLASIASQSTRNIVTPIPWQMLRSSTSDMGGSMASGFQKFVAPVPRSTLLAAPRLNLALPASANGQGWMAASSQYFNAAASNIGGVGPTATGVQIGGDASGTGVPAPATTPGVDPGSGIFNPSTLAEALTRGTNLYGTNLFSTVFGTNFMATNAFALTNPAFSTNLFAALTNFFRTNVVANRAPTNQFVNTPGAARTNAIGPNAGGVPNMVPGTVPGNVGAPPRVLQPETGGASGTAPRGVRPPGVTPGQLQPNVPPGVRVPPGGVAPSAPVGPGAGRTPTAPPPGAPPPAAAPATPAR
jgi:hypothetical protein